MPTSIWATSIHKAVGPARVRCEGPVGLGICGDRCRDSHNFTGPPTATSPMLNRSRCHPSNRFKVSPLNPFAQPAEISAQKSRDLLYWREAVAGRLALRVKAPPGTGAVQTLSGRHVTISEDRIVQMSEEDANCLRRGAPS
jgi:hypothetical protein